MAPRPRSPRRTARSCRFSRPSAARLVEAGRRGARGPRPCVDVLWCSTVSAREVQAPSWLVSATRSWRRGSSRPTWSSRSTKATPATHPHAGRVRALGVRTVIVSDGYFSLSHLCQFPIDVDCCEFVRRTATRPEVAGTARAIEPLRWAARWNMTVAEGIETAAQVYMRAPRMGPMAAATSATLLSDVEVVAAFAKKRSEQSAPAGVMIPEAAARPSNGSAGRATGASRPRPRRSGRVNWPACDAAC